MYIYKYTHVHIYIYIYVSIYILYIHTYTLGSNPGLTKQVVHADTPYFFEAQGEARQGGLEGDSPVLFTFFIALQVRVVNLGLSTCHDISCPGD